MLPLNDYNVKSCGGTLICSDNICLHLKIERVGIITLKFKRIKIDLSFGDTFVAVAIVLIQLISINKLVSWYLSISGGKNVVVIERFSLDLEKWFP